MSDLELAKSLDALIVEVCSPIFSLLVPLQSPEDADKAQDDLREHVEKSFVMLERRCFECQIPPEHIKDIKFAMAAFSDEVVLNSRWEKKYDWMAKPLAIQFFGDSAIGQNFFVRLDELRQSFDEQFDIIQLYFSVLVLGFQGKYRLEGFEKLQAYISTLRTEFEKRLGNVPRTLSDAASPESQMSSRIAGRQPYWVMAVMLVALTLIMTIFYSTKVQSAISNSAQKIEVMAQAENAHSNMVETLPESEPEQEVAQ